MISNTVELKKEHQSFKYFTNDDDDKTDLLRTKFFPKGIKILTSSVNILHKVFPTAAFKLTMQCFSIAIRRKLNSKDKSFYQKGTQKQWSLRGTKFKTYSYGNGPKVLLVHGWACNGARWNEYVEELVKKGFTAVIIDAPGHGTSPGFMCSVPNYIKVVKQVLKSANDWYGIISHSMGSIVSTVALQESKVVLTSNKLVIMSTFSDCDGLLTRFGTCIGFSDILMAGTKDWITKWTGKPIGAFSLIHSCQKLNLDLLLIHDHADIVVPSSEPNRIESALDNLECIITRGFGHNLRDPKFCEWSIDFITKN